MKLDKGRIRTELFWCACSVVLFIVSSKANIATALSLNQTIGNSPDQTSIEPRACPGCLGGSCDTHTVISGLPIVQLIAATAVGFIWAAIFIWLYANFYEGGNGAGGYAGGGGEGGYGYPPAPQPQYGYGKPVSTYNAPASTYNAPVSIYKAPSTYQAPSRSSYYSGRGLSESVANLVLESLKQAVLNYSAGAATKNESLHHE